MNIERQIEVEQRGIGRGINRYRESVQRAKESGRYSDTAPAQKLLSETILSVSTAIDGWVKKALAHGGHNGSIVKFLAQFDPDMLAFVTGKFCFNALINTPPVVRVASQIATLLENDLNDRIFKQANEKYFKKMVDQQKGKRQTIHKKLYTRRRMQKEKGIALYTLSNEEKAKVGMNLIMIFAQTTGYIEIVAKREGKKDINVLRSTPEIDVWFEKAHARLELMTPIFLPMVTEPKPWSSPFDGGYYSLRVKLVKERNLNHLEELNFHEMPKVYDALNAIQNTAWHINREMYDMMSDAMDRCDVIGSFPRWSQKPIPGRPCDYKEDAEKFYEWKREAQRCHDDNDRIGSKQMLARMCMATASMFLDEPEIFFPHSCDWRGRAYPIPITLNPQASDIAKAMLEFAKGKRLGQRGAMWLKIHTANCFGVDKVSYEDRIAWVDANIDNLLKLAAGENIEWWMSHFHKSKKTAFQAYRAAIEIREFVKHGEDLVSHLPVGMDGSNNGLQHLSVMGRDPEGAYHVNLIPTEKPQDIYQVVADAVAKRVNEDAQNGDEYAKGWVGNVNRKIVKRNVMTQAYSVTRFGMKDQIVQELKGLRDTDECPFQTDLTRESAYLARLVYESLQDIVVSAVKTMDWLKSVASVIAKDGLPVRWITPSGFYVQQAYRKNTMKRVETLIGMTRVQTSVATAVVKIDTRRMANGISPNFVHSMDSAHMMLTVLGCKEQGVDSFAMIHDSYGTFACDCDIMYQTLRETFVEMYSGNVLADLLMQIKAQLVKSPELAAQLPEPPEMGSLDVTQVLNSKYFFA